MLFSISRSTIGQLESEKQELLKELRLAESRSNQDKDDVNTDTLVTLSEVKGNNTASLASSHKRIAKKLWYIPNKMFMCTWREQVAFH